MSSSIHSLSAYDALIDATLDRYFERATAKAQLVHPRYGVLWSELKRVTLSGGKRLRPKIAILAYEACGGTDTPAVIPVASALELLHASLLVHDDIIDRELTRRGAVNVSGAYDTQHYAAIADDEQRRHYSDSAALLGGDLLLRGTFELIDTCTLPAPLIAKAKEVLHQSILEVAGGQLLDSESAFMRSENIAERIARYKTASYSFIGPMLIGASLAGAPATVMETLEVFARTLGTAYQLHDDVLSLFGDEHTTGKSTTSDLREGKHTYIVEQFLAAASPEQTAAFMALFGNPHLSENDADHLKSLLVQTGAKARAKARIDNYVAEARKALDELALDTAAHAAFEALIDASIQRTA